MGGQGGCADLPAAADHGDQRQQAFILTVVTSLSPTEAEIREDEELMAGISRHSGWHSRH